jgi:SSS family solute:Na+ symporter
MNSRPVRSLIRWLLILAAAWAADGPGSVLGSDQSPVAPELRERSIRVMREVLERQERWAKVHAAEYLLSLDYPEGVKEAFDKELESHGREPQYRIGIWRVLARAAANDREQGKWVDKIRAVFLDRAATDRLHAIETLAKLRYKVREEDLKAVELAAGPADSPMAPYARWVLVNSERPGAEARLAELLDSTDAEIRLGAAYAFRHLRSVSAGVREKLAAGARREPATSIARVFLVGAAAVHAPPGDLPALKARLVEDLASARGDTRVQACQALAQVGGEQDLAVLTPLLDDPNADLRATAADAILRIGRRVPHRLVAWDWAVIAVYALGMLSVGWYYSRRSKTREEYLLGGRKMRPTAVGVSLFAALISTISYLAWPGEMIKNGPMMVSAVLAYPVIGVVVGWLMIPFIMRLKVTSAYEILQLRLGSGVRTLGSLLFLSLRLLWMSVIVYATSSKVLIPLLGLDPGATPSVCAVLALVTVGYTTLGGLRAVVITDVIQSAILFTAAIVTVVMISVTLGGVGAWWPSQWPPYWPEPVYGYDPDARVTMFGAALATFTWFLCTSSSDQIVVQRYLATRDAKAARTMLFVTLAADVCVTLLLAMVGLGLLAYFRTFPHLLPDAQTILADGDKLFPQFIVIGLPVGLSGLVVAGLLACATSSLAAGVNSTCAVISVDFLDRFRARRARKAGQALQPKSADGRLESLTHESETERVKSLKYVSAFVGVVVVFLSLFVNMVQGNLLEVCYKVVNLLVAPLAGLFFLAMFVRRATGFGAMVGAAFGLTTVIAISYWKEITGTQGISFLWAMPLSLAVEVGVGALASLIPVGRKATVPFSSPAVHGWDTEGE